MNAHDADIQRVLTRATWAKDWGYARAVRRGSVIEVAGTTSGQPDGSVLGAGDLYLQTATALRTIVSAVEELGGTSADILRTRIFLRDIEQWPMAGRAHLEVFKDSLPVSSCVGGLTFLDPAILVEIEATAYLPEP